MACLPCIGGINFVHYFVKNVGNARIVASDIFKDASKLAQAYIGDRKEFRVALFVKKVIVDRVRNPAIEIGETEISHSFVVTRLSGTLIFGVQAFEKKVWEEDNVFVSVHLSYFLEE